MVYDNMWDPLRGISTVFVDASLITIEKRVNDLQVAIRTFTGNGNRMTTQPNWKCILCYLFYIWDLMAEIPSLVRHSFAPCC